MNYFTSKKIFSLILAATAALLWGSAGTAQSFISEGGLSALWVGAFRLCTACCFFFPLLMLRQEKNSDQQPTRYYLPKVIIAGMSMGFFNLLFFSGVKEVGIALGSCIIIGSAPLWAGVLDFLINKNKPTKMWLVGIGIAIFGGVTMALSQAQSVALPVIGLAICLGAGFCYSLYSLTAKVLVKQASPLKVSTHVFLVAAFIAVPVAWFSSGTPSFALGDLLVVLYLGLIVTGFAYLLYSTALKTINVSTAVALGLLEPVMAFTLAIIVVHEPVTFGAGLGLVAILLGLAFVLRAETSKVSTQPSVS